MKLISPSIYPRTLYVWFKVDDKQLLNSISNGMSVLEIAEDLQREHVSIIRHLSEMGLFEFESGTEEWVEIMGLCLAGVPIQIVLDWCNGAPERLSSESIEALAMGDLRPEFNFARDYGMDIPNSSAITDLGWLFNQPQAIRDTYHHACQKILDRFEVVTPLSLKNQVMGITDSERIIRTAKSFAPQPKRSYRPRTRSISNDGYMKKYRRSHA